jgi:hypothetical protein
MEKTRCKFFRAKSPYFGAVGGNGNAPGLELDNLASCWCVKTQGPMSPDNGFVAPSKCIEGRSCYVKG